MEKVNSNTYVLKKNEKETIFYLNMYNILIKKNETLQLKEHYKFNWKFINKNQLFIPRNQLRYFINKINFLYRSLIEGWFYEINLMGKGFKLFKYKNFFSFDLGYSNLFLFKNKDLTIYATKQKLIVKSIKQFVLKNLLFCIVNFYKIDKYHGKGVMIPRRVDRIYKKLM